MGGWRSGPQQSHPAQQKPGNRTAVSVCLDVTTFYHISRMRLLDTEEGLLQKNKGFTLICTPESITCEMCACITVPLTR